jgi:hypothetical protein
MGYENPLSRGTEEAEMGPLFIGVAGAAFAALCYLAWLGKLGMLAIGLLISSAAVYSFGRKKIGASARKKTDLLAKLGFTIAGCMALLRHPIPCPPDSGAACVALPVYETITAYIDKVDVSMSSFLLFAGLAMGVKFIGVLSSAFAWHLLLIGQGIRFPYWQKIVTAFLIGRFIGTFLPSTIGLDGYTLYEAGKYSGKWPRAITAKGLEKFIGVTGLFLGMVVTLPFGYSVIESVMADLGKPDAAPLMAGGILAVAGGVSAVVVTGLVYPGLLTWGMKLFGRFTPGAVRGKMNQFIEAVGAYEGKVGLLLLALANKFVTHFTTAVVYFFTALAIGVVGAEFWPVVFGSMIQILATLLSPTIAGEGAREAFQALLLKDQLGGVAPAVLSGALGFIAAEAATMWGGAFLWTRKAGWRPKFTLVDGVQVDYAWIDDEDDTGFDADKIAQARAAHAGE